MANLTRKSRYATVPQMARKFSAEAGLGDSDPDRVDRVITTRLTSWAAPADATEYVTKPGDTFHRLAEGLYGSAELWWVLADFNFQTVPNPLELEVNTVILIPPVHLVGRVASQV